MTSIALAAMAGGILVGVTGGLAAPLVGAGLASVLASVGLGTTFFTTAGGVAVVTTAFTSTGAGVASYKMAGRTRGINEFRFISHLAQDSLALNASDSSRASPDMAKDLLAVDSADSSRSDTVVDEVPVSDVSADHASTSDAQPAESIVETNTVSNNEASRDKSTILSVPRIRWPWKKVPPTPAKTSPLLLSASSDVFSSAPHITITIPGWLTSPDSWNLFAELSERKLSVNQLMGISSEESSLHAFLDAHFVADVPRHGNHLTLQYETNTLLALNNAFGAFLATEGISAAVGQVLKTTVLSTLMAAMLWPSVCASCNRLTLGID
jgi:hypothetical protein